ncbi:type I restriction-modification system subunit M [Bifidobacterium pseudolongum]|uniref:site-specific DNA-methyltransferase (adenine-specific) n=1 Tax=Bifidobacterium pseudolongum subsp. globosum TaxID=1690 RepID=A0AB37X646_9BIFI|nr:type I restriction-modification system subunit M [Bifidobacterium pseudolongum]RYQ37988.1 type I restriction-modification protein subunit M [Bifidobacterium pseudolongum subsp. globosum]
MASTTQNDARELTSKLWAMANDLRGKMDASEYRDYILGFIFYRYLSKRQERYLANSGLLEFTDTENSSNPQDVNNAFARQVALDGLEDWREDLALQNGYAIDPEYTWTTIINKVQAQTIRPDDYQNLFSQFKANALLNTNATEDFKDVFDNINLMDSSLGNSVSARAKALSQLVERIDSIDFHDDSGHDILGDVYEYLIAEFAGASGKKAGEFYTPHEVSRVLAKLVTYVSTDSSEEAKEVIEHASRPFMVYDPTMGSGSLLLTVQHELKSETDNPDTARVHFFGQEINRTTYNLARMNLMMHDVKYQYMDLRCADTLESDWPNGMDENGIDHPEFFDAVVANPPYSLKWDNAESKLKDPRFKDYGKLAPKSKADYAFVEHGIYHLKPSGRMAIVLPHGVLFRGAAEGTIRKAIIDKNYLDAVIGLPSNLFYSTGIPTVILVFRKDRKTNDVLFIDASQHFEKDKKQNRLREEDIDLILETYKNRQDVDKLAHVATLEEIKDNDYNLNIPRYVDTFEEEEPIDLDDVNRQLAEVNEKIARLEKELETMLAELVPTDQNDEDDE